MAPIKKEKALWTTTPTRNHSRLETNLLRLLSRCEAMAMDTEQLQDNWRLEKFVAALEVMLSDLRTGPNQPERDTLLEYGRRVEFIKGVLHTAKLPTVSEKVVASQLINPGPHASGSDHNQSMEIKQRHVTKYAEDLRRELLGESSQQSSPISQEGNKHEDMDELLKYHHNMQEKIAEHMLELTRSLKDQVITAGQIIKTDTETLDRSSKLVDVNQGSLKVESEKLEMYNKSACKCWVWILLVIVCSTFIGMVLFMRLFKKRLVVPSS